MTPQERGSSSSRSIILVDSKELLKLSLLREELQRTSPVSRSDHVRNAFWNIFWWSVYGLREVHWNSLASQQIPYQWLLSSSQYCWLAVRSIQRPWPFVVCMWSHYRKGHLVHFGNDSECVLCSKHFCLEINKFINWEALVKLLLLPSTLCICRCA